MSWRSGTRESSDLKSHDFSYFSLYTELKPLSSGTKSRFGKPTSGREESPKLNHVGTIHLQKFNSHSTFRGQANDATADDLKVRRPIVKPWVEESHQRPCCGIDRGEVRPLEAVAHGTRVGQVALDCRAAMLDGYDVIRLMPQTGIVLVQLAVLTSSTGALPDELPKFEGNPIAHGTP